jgi:hypothetical protein
MTLFYGLVVGIGLMDTIRQNVKSSHFGAMVSSRGGYATMMFACGGV